MKAILTTALLAATLVPAQAAPLNEETRKQLADGALNICIEGQTRWVEKAKSHITKADLLNVCNCFAVAVSRTITEEDTQGELPEAAKQRMDQAAEYCKVPYFVKDTGTPGAVFFNRRGYAYHAKGDYDRAIADYDEAIRISPKYVNAYHMRGFAHFAKGELDHAIADYTEAIRLNQQYAISYRNRGIAHLYSGSPAKAQTDLETAIQLTPKDAYLALWREIAARRANAPSILAHAVSLIDMATWPGPIVRFLLGESTQAALLASAKDLDPKKSTERLCEANFFLGQLALQRGSKEAAKAAFQIAGRDCPRQFLEVGAAAAELRALDNKQDAVTWMVVLSVLSLLMWIARKSGSKSQTSSSAAKAPSTPAAAARERARQQEEEERHKAAARERARQQEEEERQKVAARKRQREQEEAVARERARQQEEEERQRAEAARKRQRDQEEAAARERARQQEEEERQRAEAARKRRREREEERERRRNSSQGKLSVPQALEILGLNAGATEQQVRAAYNRLMKRVHPDVGGSNFFAKQLNEARETLCGAS